jgi:hypothetical protein
VTNLSHSASFHSVEWIAPSNRGIKQLGSARPGRDAQGADLTDPIRAPCQMNDTPLNNPIPQPSPPRRRAAVIPLLCPLPEDAPRAGGCDRNMVPAAPRGIWSAMFDVPWDWRQARRDASSVSPPPVQRLLTSAWAYLAIRARPARRSTVAPRRPDVCRLAAGGWQAGPGRDVGPCESLC